MKKYYLHFVSVLAVAMLSLCAISCGDDDKDEPGGGDTKAELQGTWGLIQEEITQQTATGTSTTQTVYNYLEPSKEGELVISFKYENGSSYSLRQYNYDFNQSVWVLIDNQTISFDGKTMRFTNVNVPEAPITSADVTITSDRLIISSQRTWGSAKQTFRRVTSEVKETNTLHINK